MSFSKKQACYGVNTTRDFYLVIWFVKEKIINDKEGFM